MALISLPPCTIGSTVLYWNKTTVSNAPEIIFKGHKDRFTFYYKKTRNAGTLCTSEQSNHMLYGQGRYFRVFIVGQKSIYIYIHHNHHHQCSSQRQVLHCKRRNLGCSSAEGRSSTADSDTKAAFYKGFNRCGSFPFLSASHSLFTI